MFGEALGDAKKREARDIFDRALKGKLDKVSPGLFDSQLPPIESIFINSVHPEGGRSSINVRLTYRNERGEERHSAWSVFEDGVVSGKVPPDLPVDREDIALEILRTLERADFDFWRKTNVDVLPDADEIATRPLSEVEKEETEEEKSGDSLTRIERLRFLESQPNVLVGFVNEQNGFKGYRGALFPNFILLEHPEHGNAAYIVDLKEPLPVGKEVFDKPAPARLDDETFERIIESVWKPIANEARTRGELRRKFGAERIIHSPKTWRDRLQRAIDERVARVGH